MKHLLLCFIAALLLMPSPLMADNAKKKIKTLDITMDMPTADMDLNAGEELALKSVQTAYGDLFKSGVISLMSISWDGEFGENSDEIPTFKAGFPYIATIQLLIDPSSNYQTDYKTINGDLVLSPDNFKVTINGKATRLLKDCAPYFPIVTLSFTVPGGKPGPQNKEIPFLEYNEYKSEFRSTLPYVSRKEADELNPALHSFDVLVMDRPYKFKELMYDKSFTTSSGHSYKKHNMLFISKIIIDVSNRADNNNVSEFTDLLGSMFSDIVNLKEVWLSSKVDILKYIRDLHKATVNPVFPQYRQYEEQSSKLYTAKGTLFIPEQAANAVLSMLATDPTEPSYTIRTYSGDVYAAQKAGVSATKVLTCTKHTFTAKIKTADRVCQYQTCKRPFKWYYSCSVCGKCEYNKAHTFGGGTGAEYISVHDMYEDIASDQAYIGVNAAGGHVYWKSCIFCGIPHNYHMHHLTPADQKMMGIDGSFAEYKQGMLETLRTIEEQSLLQTSLMSDEMFILPLKSEANMSVWAQDGVNRALCDNLIDDNVLGTDYTKPVTRDQLRSIMTRLVKEMTSKDATAAAIGLTDATLPQSGIVTRQELAAYVHRTLMYIERNSDLAYSEYEPKLSKYADNAQVKEWAKEPMGFCDVFELIDPKNATTLAPNETCSIEQALVTAERATMAHRTGWYMAAYIDEFGNFLSSWGVRNLYTIHSSFGSCDQIWAGRIRNGMYDKLPSTEPFTGSRCYIDAGVMHPIRAKMGRDYHKKVKE